MSTHIMVDLESFAGSSKFGGNYIVQIGACRWNIDSGEIKEEFLVNTIPSREFQTDYDTIRWWMNQPDVARKSLFTPTPIPLDTALVAFADWYKSKGTDGLWSHATFDVPALQQAYGQYLIPIPWPYRSAKDIRTLNWLAQDLGIDLKALPRVEATVEHNGLADAIEQAKNVTTVLNAIKGSR